MSVKLPIITRLLSGIKLILLRNKSSDLLNIYGAIRQQLNESDVFFMIDAGCSSVNPVLKAIGTSKRFGQGCASTEIFYESNN